MKAFPLMTSPVPVLWITLGYFAFVVYGPRYMADRKPLELKSLLQIYNLCMICLSFFISATLALAAWTFFASKFVEYLDTVFIILRKKSSHLTFLHIIHHGVLPFAWWFGVKFSPDRKPIADGRPAVRLTSNKDPRFATRLMREYPTELGDSTYVYGKHPNTVTQPRGYKHINQDTPTELGDSTYVYSKTPKHPNTVTQPRGYKHINQDTPTELGDSTCVYGKTPKHPNKVTQPRGYKHINQDTPTKLGIQIIKDKINKLSTKDDINSLSTKDDINSLSTKDDKNTLSTKDDMNSPSTKDEIKQRRGYPTIPGCCTHCKTPKHSMQKHKADKHRKRRKGTRDVNAQQRNIKNKGLHINQHDPRCRLRTAICYENNKRCSYPGLPAHNPPTFPIIQRSQRCKTTSSLSDDRTQTRPQNAGAQATQMNM
ncbi:hypothetical protein FSP39_006841 [Pinctada imbricata]|uniref:Elongation of very long chain fatty acids protein n=1 Tax=Pinctada imbricata TaxID=66713 RepID=A0AA88YFQ8_PINIB|nr:hypothetical protein FSP39_006841 [Pinctada imbricata]